METVIKIRIESHYGRPFYYPDNEVARQLCQLVNCKTLTVVHLKILQRMGFALRIERNDRHCQELIRALLAA